MRRLRFDFAPPSRRPQATSLIALGLASAVAMVAVSAWVERSRAIDRLDAELRLAQQSARGAADAALASKSRAGEQTLHQALAVIDFPVIPLLRALQPPAELQDVGVVALELVSRGGANSGPRVRVTAHASSLLLASDYVKHLARNRATQEVQLVRHEFVEERQSPVVQFVIELSWGGSGRG